MIDRTLQARIAVVVIVVAVAGFVFGFAAPGLAEAQEVKPDRAESGSGSSYVLVPKSVRRIKAELTIEVKGPNVKADEWSFYVSQIPELPGQVEVKTTLIPRGKVARDLGDEARPILFTRIPSEGEQGRTGAKARVEYEMTLIERRLERREPGNLEPSTTPNPIPTPPEPRLRRLWLSSGHQFDFQSPRFRAWLDDHKLRREPGEGEVDFARKVFLAVRQGFTHDEGPDVPHLASKVCERGKSDFAGLTAVFVAGLRANGIPTRVLAGRMILREGQPSKFSWPHARAEFYAQGVGWVPADPAGAIRSGRKTEGLEFFGNDPAEFLTHHLDTDIVVDTYFGSKTHEWLQDPAWWVIGGGNFEGSTTKVDVVVETENLNLTDVLERLMSRSPSSRKSSSKTSKTSKKGG